MHRDALWYGRKQHKVIHNKLVDQVMDYQKRLVAGDPTVSINLMTSLKDWLNNHIKVTHTKNMPFMKENGIIFTLPYGSVRESENSRN